jgi:hypothetical protein
MKNASGRPSAAKVALEKKPTFRDGASLARQTRQTSVALAMVVPVMQASILVV